MVSSFLYYFFSFSLSKFLKDTWALSFLILIWPSMCVFCPPTYLSVSKVYTFRLKIIFPQNVNVVFCCLLNTQACWWEVWLVSFSSNVSNLVLFISFLFFFFFFWIFKKILVLFMEFWNFTRMYLGMGICFSV